MARKKHHLIKRNPLRRFPSKLRSTRKAAPELSIIIPAYNEEQLIEKTLAAFEWHFSKKHNFEIIAVCDGNTDRTPEIVSKYSKRHRHVRLITFQTRLGKGGSLIQGFKLAKGDFIGFVDADSSISPSDFDRLFTNLKKSSYDGVVASRYLVGSRILLPQPFYRKFMSRGWNLLVRILLGLPFTDIQCCAKIFRKKALFKVLPDLQSHGSEFDVELLLRLYKAGYKIAEAPVAWLSDRHAGFGFLNIVKMFCTLLKLSRQ